MSAALPPINAENAELVIATARAENFRVLSDVIDESIRKAAEAREKREAAEAERRQREEAAERVAEIERREREAAEEVALRRRTDLKLQVIDSEIRKQRIIASANQHRIDVLAA